VLEATHDNANTNRTTVKVDPIGPPAGGERPSVLNSLGSLQVIPLRLSSPAPVMTTRIVEKDL